MTKENGGDSILIIVWRLRSWNVAKLFVFSYNRAVILRYEILLNSEIHRYCGL